MSVNLGPEFKLEGGIWYIMHPTEPTRRATYEERLAAANKRCAQIRHDVETLTRVAGALTDERLVLVAMFDCDCIQEHN
jgi:hypothetical protein